MADSLSDESRSDEEVEDPTEFDGWLVKDDGYGNLGRSTLGSVAAGPSAGGPAAGLFGGGGPGTGTSTGHFDTTTEDVAEEEVPDASPNVFFFFFFFSWCRKCPSTAVDRSPLSTQEVAAYGDAVFMDRRNTTFFQREVVSVLKQVHPDTQARSLVQFAGVGVGDGDAVKRGRGKGRGNYFKEWAVVGCAGMDMYHGNPSNLVHSMRPPNIRSPRRERQSCATFLPTSLRYEESCIHDWLIVRVLVCVCVCACKVSPIALFD